MLHNITKAIPMATMSVGDNLLGYYCIWGPLLTSAVAHDYIVINSEAFSDGLQYLVLVKENIM